MIQDYSVIPFIYLFTFFFKNCEKDQTRVDITYKLYYGGGQKRPDAGYSRVVQIGNSYAEVPESNR